MDSKKAEVSVTDSRFNINKAVKYVTEMVTWVALFVCFTYCSVQHAKYEAEAMQEESK